MAHVINTGARSATFADLLRERAAELRARIEKYRLYRKTLEELRTLSARELNDLGMSEYDLTRIAREAVYGDR